MARSINNFLTKGLKGMVGKQLVFRSWNGKTYVSVAPKKPKKQSALQKENRSKFKQASIFAKSMMKNPERKAEYQELAKKLKLPNAYTAAITDYMRNPELKEVDMTNYSGKKGEKIKIVAVKKNFKVQEVEVLVVDNDGAIIEEGKATRGSGAEWLYETLADVGKNDLIHLLIKVKDGTGKLLERKFSKAF